MLTEEYRGGEWALVSLTLAKPPAQMEKISVNSTGIKIWNPLFLCSNIFSVISVHLLLQGQALIPLNKI